MILVTGASGALGGLIVRRLTATAQVVAGTRSPSHLDTDVPVRAVDFDRPGTLTEAFAGIDVLVLISAGYAEDDVVIARHDAAVETAERAGVRHVVYTSLAGSGDHLSFAVPHRWTERRLAASTVPSTILRNGLYAELIGAIAVQTTVSDVLTAPWGDGRITAVAREDLADVAALVAAEAQAAVAEDRSSRHAGRTYELDGVVAIGGADIAEALTRTLGREVRYEPASLGDTRAALTEAGLPPYQVAHSVSTFANLTAGFLAGTRTDLPALLDADPRLPLDVIVAGNA
ncbi:NAD(P)H-binding protein [Solihabitans fulvus]|uniref:NAD(P)H-binding protein n=1 Tax=Solihabitans fulvus TaxID=1892852 RepID=A0A5B2XSS8_9PSEU|nr:NAD(P)H-binding protein [Solihabitans fulvus]KAA2266968.1 NAD(P)H-binding protein [Solihabitans fulvus]